MGNRLPYLDGVKILVITDISTSAAALRTGKADFGTVIPADDAKTLIHEVPEFKYTTYMSSYPYVIAMRIDKTDGMMKGVCDSIKQMIAGGENAVRRRRYPQKVFTGSSYR
jgi:hypothetical protein